MNDISEFSDLDQLYLLNISKTSICNFSFEFISRCISFLHKQGSKSFGSVIIMIDGYGDDPAEIYEIPEVRKWMSELFIRYPYFLYFINYSLDSHISLLSCIGDIAVVYAGVKTQAPMEYKRQGIDPIHDVEPKKWVITLSDNLFFLMKRALIDYGQQINDFLGPAETIKMITVITNRS